MPWLRSLALLLAAMLLAGAGLLADPKPPRAHATSLPCVGLSPAGVVGDAIGIGNPIGDACEAVTDPILGAAGDKILGPLKEAAGQLGKGVFNQVTSWVADGAVWLVGQIALGINETTSPNLLSKGFLHQYKLMGQIAALLAALMLIFVVLEALTHGELSLLWRAFLVNVPLAAIATSVAYVVVQILLATSDGMSETVAQTAGADGANFFKGAIEALAAVGAKPGAVAGVAIGGPGLEDAAGGQEVGEAAGSAAVPLFVGFIAAIVMAFAALFLWMELLMRDAAVYAVALFMPLTLAAAISPRWASVLRRSCELLLVVIFSKFVIVAIISLAASLVTRGEGSVEQLLAAATLLLLACFAPFVLFQMVVSFADGAVSAAYGRRSAGAGAVRGIQTSSSVQMMRRAAMANWAASAGGGPGGGSNGGGGGGAAGEGRGKPPLGGAGGPAGSVDGGGGATAATGAGAAGGAATPAAAGASAAKAAKGGAEKLAGTAVAGAASSSSGGSGGSETTGSQAADGGRQYGSPPRPASAGGGGDTAGGAGAEPPVLGSGAGMAKRPGISAEPTQPRGGDAPQAGAAPPRPSSAEGGSGGAGDGGKQ